MNLSSIVASKVGALESSVSKDVSKKLNNLFSGLRSKKLRTPQSRVNASITGSVSISDWRISLVLPPHSPLLPSVESNMQPLKFGTTGAFIFPITPSITTSTKANYEKQNLTHANFSMFFYEYSEVSAITLTAPYPVQNNQDAAYYIAAIYFFRSLTKMFWGSDKNAGSPPSLVFLKGLGTTYFPLVPCVITGFTHTIEPNVDFYEYYPHTTVNVDYIPTVSSFSVDLQPVYSRERIRSFSVEEFSAGKLLNKGFI